MSEFAEKFSGAKCRPIPPIGSDVPRLEDAREEDFPYTVVACWIDRTTSPPGLYCAVVSDVGAANIVNFLLLQFWAH